MNFDSGSAETRAFKLFRARLNISRWLRALRESGKISSGQYDGGLDFFSMRPKLTDWTKFIRCFGGLGGLLLAVAGICFLLHWYWHDLHRYLQIGSAQALFAGLAVFTVIFWRKWYSYLSYLGAALSIGAVLAAFTRVYPTGVESWEVFRAWSLALLPLTALRPRVSMVFLLWAASSLWLASYMREGVELSFWAAFFSPEFALYQFLFFMCCELFAHITRNMADRFDPFRLLARAIGAVAMLTFTLYAIDKVILDQFLSKSFIINLTAFPVIAIYIQVVLVVACFYFLVKQDLFFIALCIFSPLVFLGAQITVILGDYESSVGKFSLLILGFSYTALFLAGAQLILIVRRYLRQKVCASGQTDASAPPICSPMDFLADAESKSRIKDWAVSATGSENADIDAFFAQETRRQEQSQPWYMELLISIVLWTAAGAIIYFLLTSLPNDKSITAITFLSAMLVVAGVFMSYRYDRNLIMKQVSLVVILTGMCSLAYYAQLDTVRVMGLYSFIFTLLWLSLKPSVAKTFAAISALYCLIFYLVRAPYVQGGDAAPPAINGFFHADLLVMVFTLIVGLLLSLILTHMTRPLPAKPEDRTKLYFYHLKKSAALGTISFVLLIALFDLRIPQLPDTLELLKTPSLIVMVAVLGFTARLAAGNRSLRYFYLPMGGALVILAWFAPGISLAFVLMLIAKYQGYYALDVIASVYLCLAAFFFFYGLGEPELVKAGLLLGSGIMLLLGGYLSERVLARFISPKEEGHA